MESTKKTMNISLSETSDGQLGDVSNTDCDTKMRKDKPLSE